MQYNFKKLQVNKDILINKWTVAAQFIKLKHIHEYDTDFPGG